MSAPPQPWLARTDRCPECVTNTETPITVEPVRGGYLATYVCAACGHHWTTSWADLDWDELFG